MKKVLLLIALASISYLSQAQELGARFGDAVGGSVAIDAIISVGKYSRVHADVSFGKGVGIEALYDFIYRPLGEEAVHYYIGAGPFILIDDPFKFGFSGEIGLEYKFASVPIVLGADWRPSFIIIEDTDFDAGGFGFNVRYVFGEKKS